MWGSARTARIPGTMESCIVFVTRDRPITALANLLLLSRSGIPIIVLDNSRKVSLRREIQASHHFSQVWYHGSLEQARLLESTFRFIPSVYNYIGPLGAGYWNTGHIRNYAILLCNILRVQKVFFIDDDIAVRDPRILKLASEMLDHVDFIGVRFNGVPDQSVIGHIQMKIGDSDCFEFPSGGLLGFDLASVTEPVLNYYNEDWMWVLMHRHSSYAMIPRAALHKPQGDTRNAPERAIWQEIGEIMFDGVWNAAVTRDFSRLINDEEWDAVVKEKIVWIENIIEQCRLREERFGEEIGIRVLRHISTMSASLLTAIFSQYYMEKPKWNRILKASSRLTMKRNMQELNSRRY